MIIQKPYKLFWILIPLILLISMLRRNSFVDLQFHDTYFVINAINIGVLLSLILGISGILYWIFRKRKLIGWLTQLHVFSMLIIIIAILILIYLNSFLTPIGDFENYMLLMNFWYCLILATLLSQFLFFTNLIVSLFNPKKNS